MPIYIPFYSADWINRVLNGVGADKGITSLQPLLCDNLAILR